MRKEKANRGPSLRSGLRQRQMRARFDRTGLSVGNLDGTAEWGDGGRDVLIDRFPRQPPHST